MALPSLAAYWHLPTRVTVLHAAARQEGRRGRGASMATIDTQLTHGASNGGVIFRDRGSPCSRTKGARPVVPVDVTGLPVGAGGGRLDPRASATACYTPIALGCDVGGVHRS
jgi:hypothetical protein